MNGKRLIPIVAVACAIALKCCFAGELAEARRLAPKYGVPESGIEKTLDDGTRVDLLSDREAIEVDWAPKWCEAVGQSLHYALHTGRRPGIILLIRDEGDIRFVKRCQAVCAAIRFKGCPGPSVHVEPVDGFRRE